MEFQLKDSKYRYDLKNSEGYLEGYSSMEIVSDSNNIVRKIILNKKISPAFTKIIQDAPTSLSKFLLKKQVTNPLEISLILGYLQ